MRQAVPARALGVVLAVTGFGCASAVEPPPTGPSSSAPTQPRPVAVVAPTLESITSAVVADAAARTGVPAAGIVIEAAVAVTWPDGSLGCPQPGMTYTMALVPGYRIRVRAGTQRLDYHASRRGQWILCPGSLAGEPMPGGVDQ